MCMVCASTFLFVCNPHPRHLHEQTPHTYPHPTPHTSHVTHVRAQMFVSRSPAPTASFFLLCLLKDIDRLFALIGQAMRDGRRGPVLDFTTFSTRAKEALRVIGQSRSGRVTALLTPEPVVELFEHVRDWTGLIVPLVDTAFTRFAMSEASGEAVHRFWFTTVCMGGWIRLYALLGWCEGGQKAVCTTAGSIDL